MRPELYVKVANRYIEKYSAMRSEGKEHNHFIDTAGNVLAVIRLYADDLLKDSRAACRRDFIQSYTMAKIYFSLMDKYPQFRQAELNLYNGYFPDIHEFVTSQEGKIEMEQKGIKSQKHHYILLAKEKLEGIIAED